MRIRRGLLLALALIALVAGLAMADDYCFAGIWVAVGLILGMGVEALPELWGQK